MLNFPPHDGQHSISTVWSDNSSQLVRCSQRGEKVWSLVQLPASPLLAAAADGGTRWLFPWICSVSLVFTSINGCNKARTQFLFFIKKGSVKNYFMKIRTRKPEANPTDRLVTNNWVTIEGASSHLAGRLVGWFTDRWLLSREEWIQVSSQPQRHNSAQNNKDWWRVQFTQSSCQPAQPVPNQTEMTFHIL